MGDPAKQWYKYWVRDRDALGRRDQISGKNPHTPHYGVNITTGTEFPHTVCQPDTLAGRVDPYGSVYSGSGSTGGGYNADLVDERTRAEVSRLDERIVAEQTMRLECLKVAASMQVSPAEMLDTAESLLKWVRGH